MKRIELFWNVADVYRAQFHKTCKHKILLSTDKLCLAETGYQQTFHKVYIVVTGAPLTFCLV